MHFEAVEASSRWMPLSLSHQTNGIRRVSWKSESFDVRQGPDGNAPGRGCLQVEEYGRLLVFIHKSPKPFWESSQSASSCVPMGDSKCYNSCSSCRYVTTLAIFLRSSRN